MIQEKAPSFTASAMMPVTKMIDEINLSDFTGKWVVLFYFPFSFTFVCPTEITSFSDRQPEFEALNCQVLGASCDSTQSHIAWSNIPRNEGGIGEMKIPIISDFNKSIAREYGILLPDGTPLRATFIISPLGKFYSCIPRDCNAIDLLRDSQVLYVTCPSTTCPWDETWMSLFVW